MHHPAWARLLAETYGFQGFALMLEDGSDVVGGVPVLRVGLPGRRRLVSLPFTDSCPPLVPAELEPLLANALDDLRRERGLAQIELRGELSGAGAQSEAVAVVHELALDPDPDAVAARFHKRVHRSIRKAERLGVTIKCAESVENITETFYNLHLTTRRRLGVPVQPRRFFHLLWERILEPGLGELLLAEHEGRVVAAAVFLHGDQRTIYKYGASDERFWNAQPNHALFSAAISSAAQAGRKVFDFGRSGYEDTGLREFKSTWGAAERPLVYTTIGGGPPAPSLGGAAAAARGVIRRSPPWVCELLGRALYKYSA